MMLLVGVDVTGVVLNWKSLDHAGHLGISYVCRCVYTLCLKSKSLQKKKKKRWCIWCIVDECWILFYNRTVANVGCQSLMDNEFIQKTLFKSSFFLSF